MAFVPKQLPDNEENKMGSTSPTTPFPQQPQGGGSAGTGQGQGGTAPGMASSTQFGSNAAKLSDYLAANKDQTAQFGQQVAGNLIKGYNDTMGAVNQGFQNFGQQVNQGYTPYDPTLVNNAASNPTDFVKDQGNVDKFKSIYNDQYTGPQNAESSDIYSGLNNQVNQAVQNGGLVNSSAGLQTYLNNNMGTANNTPGMQSLDTALLQRSPEARTAISSAAEPYKNLQNYLSGQVAGADTNIQNAKNAAGQAKQSAQDAFTGQNGAIPNFQSDLNNRVSKARTDATDKTTKEVADIKAGKATPQEISDFNLDPNNLKNFNSYVGSLNNDYGNNFDLSNYFTPMDAESAITPGTLASADDYARASALSQLTGTDLSSVLNPKNSSQAGTAPNILSSLDLGKAQNDVSSDLSSKDVLTLQQNSNPTATSDPRLAEIFGRNKTSLNPAQMAWWMKQVGLSNGSVGSPSSPGNIATGPNMTPIGFGGPPGVF